MPNTKYTPLPGVQGANPFTATPMGQSPMQPSPGVVEQVLSAHAKQQMGQQAEQTDTVWDELKRIIMGPPER